MNSLEKINSNRLTIRRFYLLYTFLLPFFIIYFSGSALFVVSNFRFSVIACALFSIPFLPNVFFAYRNAKAINLHSAFYLFFTAIILCNTFAFFENRIFNFYMLAQITVAFGITLSVSVKRIFRSIPVLTTLICIVTILGTFLLENTNLMKALPEFTSNNGWVYKIGIIYNYMPVIKDRVLGPFWEPGILASFLCVGLCFHICAIDDKVRIRNLLFIALHIYTIVLSTSTAGYVLSVFCVILLLVKNAKTETKARQLWRLGIFFISLLLFLNMNTILTWLGLAENEYVSKLFDFFDSSRYTSIWRNLSSFLKSPILGLGLTQAQQLEHYMDTSTTTNLLVVFGIGGLTYTLALLWGIIKLKKINPFMKIILVIIAISIINKEPHHASLATWIIIFSLLKHSCERSKNVTDQKTSLYNC